MPCDTLNIQPFRPYLASFVPLARLSDVKSLNCWGQDLADVSILSQMPNVEVLSLSVNQISTLRYAVNKAEAQMTVACTSHAGGEVCMLFVSAGTSHNVSSYRSFI